MYNEIKVTKIGASSFNRSIPNCTITIFKLEQLNTTIKKIETRILTHCELIIENDDCFSMSDTLLDFVYLVKQYHADNTCFTNKMSTKIDALKCICVMQSREFERDYVALFCALDICLEQLEINKMVNVRDAIRNVRLQLNAMNTSFTTLKEYAFVFRALLRYARKKRFTHRSNKYPHPSK